MSVISNTTVLINFAAIGRLPLLQRIFTTLHIPIEVYTEIRDGYADGYTYLADVLNAITPPETQGWLHLASMQDTEIHRYATLPNGLHAGEAACIAIAGQRQWLVLTDDRAARTEAQRQGIRVSGSIGCLVLGVERGFQSIDQANAALAAMVNLGYRAPLTDLTPLVSRNSAT